ncbi:hypothetical protein CH379_018545 [Leptospira ellisii]|uniref:DUF4376 domain-containing protein n=1 Tax=Leptospira ellisii TaxID=2023197 RepID=A0A2N0B425_9LEPT|nr:hypothetical protein [Leptospira ellisii]MDV6237637.1 hypothetical protein [Leptospira ellisii]PJZ91294.1 hypothetical protein CH379_19445 [Leptospira ellisii]PKA03987.1 hypothetical protein CH375_13705 [Leptospira ellisii]
MFLISLKENSVKEESNDESKITIWYQMCLADPEILVSAKWPIPKMKIVDGKLIFKPESEWEVPTDITLDDLRAKRKRELATKYSQVCESGVEFEGEIFQTSEKSVNRIGLALQDWVRGIQTPYWIRKNDSHHPISSYPQFDSLATAISIRWRTLLHVYTSLRDEINSFDSDELLSLNVNSRWSEIESEVSA